MVDHNQAFNEVTYPHPEFWHIAANEGCTAIIGVDAHDSKALEYSGYYDQAYEALKELKIKTIDRIEFLKY